MTTPPRATFADLDNNGKAGRVAWTVLIVLLLFVGCSSIGEDEPEAYDRPSRVTDEDEYITQVRANAPLITATNTDQEIHEIGELLCDSYEDGTSLTTIVEAVSQGKTHEQVESIANFINIAFYYKCPHLYDEMKEEAGDLAGTTTT